MHLIIFPVVPGIGEKTAIKLVNEYDSIEILLKKQKNKKSDGLSWNQKVDKYLSTCELGNIVA